MRVSEKNPQHFVKTAENRSDNFFTGAPVNNMKKIHHPHETWCLRVALRLCGAVKTHQVFRHNRVVDGIMTIDEPVSLWGPLGAFLGHREVLIEHYSDSVSQAEFCGCLEKIAFASSRYFSVPSKHRGEKRSPVMTILAYRKPDRLLRENGLFEELCPGIWVRRPLEMGAIYFVAATHLPTDPEFDWLRMSTRLPESREEILLVESLLSSRKIDRITKAELEETMFELMIDGKTPKEAKAEAMELRSRLADALEAKEEAMELRSRLAEAVDVQTTLQKALEQETREREKLSLELAEMQRQLAEFKDSK